MAQSTLISPGANWKYLDDGSDQGNAWTWTTFDDSGWANGNAELGYGDSDENTVVSFGPDAGNKYITTYFRKTISVTDPNAFTFLNLGVVIDDGCVVYVNGAEVYRQDMPTGTIFNSTPASATIAWPFEDDWTFTNVSSSVLQAGNNVIAVEVHQESGGSSDISFNLELIGETTAITANIERGPYLQRANQNEIWVCWRTDTPTDSKVNFGMGQGNLDQTITDPNFVTDHFVKIDALTESTMYYYEIGNTSEMFTPQATQYFKTHPQEGKDDQKWRFWAIGDSGMGNGDQDAVTNSFMSYNNNQHIDGWIMLGDNAYESGFDSEYQDGFFDAYPQILPNTVVWPSPGNHDYNNHIPFSPPPAYYEIFHLPTNAEAGGYASGTEKYYSWNFGNVHFISLDSYDEGRNTSDPMAQWLVQDLANNTQPWIVAYWHHPPYTKGSHDSDNWLLDGELIDMRENILPILEDGGIDLILNGHSHCYERSNLIDGHYGEANTFTPGVHLLDAGSGDYVNDCPYIKNTDNGSDHLGTLCAVVGCSGKLSGTSSGWPHPVFHAYTNTTLGSMIIEVEGGRMDCKFIDSNGDVWDKFSIVKDLGGEQTVEVCAGNQLTLTPSWNGNAYWEPVGIYNSQFTFNPIFNTTYYASDSLGCVSDTFNIVMKDLADCGVGIEEVLTSKVQLLNNQIPRGDNLQLLFSQDWLGNEVKVQIISVNGQLIDETVLTNLTGKHQVSTQNIMSSGNYVIRIVGTDNSKPSVNIKFIIY